MRPQCLRAARQRYGTPLRRHDACFPTLTRAALYIPRSLSDYTRFLRTPGAAEASLQTAVVSLELPAPLWRCARARGSFAHLACVPISPHADVPYDRGTVPAACGTARRCGWTW